MGVKYSLHVITAIVLVSLWCIPAHALNARGHELVGAIADQLLAGTPTEVRLKKLIGVPLREAAKWADCARSVSPKDGAFKFKHNDRYDRPCIPLEMAVDAEGSHFAVERMEDFVSRNWSNCENNGKRQQCHATYHYTNVAIQRTSYDRKHVGTSDTDIVAATGAAIARIKEQPVPAPFNIKDEAEAVFMLAHYLGDIHQPLHVGAVFLDEQGRVIDPDAPNAPPYETTAGGNWLHDGGRNLHEMWDGVPTNARWKTDRFVQDHANAARKQFASLKASEVPQFGWLVAAWATETLDMSKEAFSPMQFSKGPLKADGTLPDRSWVVSYVGREDHASYVRKIPRYQEEQVLKAGVRLAYLLQLLFPN